MRRIANFTLHAALGALAAASAAAQYAAGHFYVQLDGNDEGLVGSAEGDRKGNWIEIDSWQWGEAARADSWTVKQGMRPAPSKAARVPFVPFEYEVKSPRDVATGQSSGKRQHEPVTVTRQVERPSLVLPRPLPQGSLRVKVKMPWLACRVGATYPAISLFDGAKARLLHDVRVADCGGAAGQEGSVTFVYGKLG